MRQISTEELKKIQLDILVYLDEVCRANNIRYSLGYGTLLGAVRHKGFIPWDDDIDVVMLREEYEKLIYIMENEKNNKFQLLTPEKEGYWYAYAKLSDTRTYIKEENWPSKNFIGVNIDIFPLDYVERSNARKKYDEISLICRAIDFNLTDIAYADQNPIKKIVKKIVRYKEVSKYRKKDEWFWKQQLKEYIRKLEKSDTLSCLLTPPFSIWNIECFKKLTEIKFEGKSFCATEKYDEVLTEIYGDYMKLPPKEQRKSDHDFIAYWK